MCRLRVRQSRTDKDSEAHSTSLLYSSGERVGRISKRTLNCPGGEIKEQQEHTNPYWTTVSFPDLCCGLLVSVGGFGLTLACSSALC